MERKIPCERLIVAEANIGNLKETDVGINTTLTSVNKCLGRLDERSDQNQKLLVKMLKHTVPPKEWPEEVKKLETENLKLTIKAHKWKIVTTVIITLCGLLIYAAGS